MTVRGMLGALPYPDATVPVALVAVRAGGDWQSCRGQVRVRPPVGDAGSHGMVVGRRLWLRGRWWASPGDPARTVESRGVLVLDTAGVDGPAEGHIALGRIRAGLQRHIREFFPQQGALVEALVLARREGLDPVLRQQFVDAGLSHLLAISGTHVALIAGILLLVAKAFGASGVAGAGVAAAGTVAYVLLLGAPAAATRAALQIVLLLGARVMQRPADPFTLLATAALVLLGTDPAALLDPGFQLSFAGVAGILTFGIPLSDWLRTRLPGWLATPLAISLAASALTLPIAGLRFGRVAPIGIAASLVAIPVLGSVIPAILVTLLVGCLSAALGHWLAHSARLLLRAMNGIARLAAAVPGGHAPTSPGTIMAGLLAAATLILVHRGLRDAASGAPRPRERILHWGMALAAALTVLVWLPRLHLPVSEGVEIHAIDVGQGDAFAIRSPHGHWILVDDGPRSDRFDAGRSRVVPYLLRHGVHRLDALILTHPDGDHIGGTEAVLQSLHVATVVDPGVAAGKPLYLTALTTAHSEQLRWLAARAGREVHIDDLDLRFLFPDSSALDGPAAANDFSVVFRLGYGPFGALFLGDAPRAVENRLVARYGSALAVDVLKVGHHGSRTSTGDSLLTVAHPRIALLSVGRHNRYGHPAPEVVARLRERGIRILRTDRDGSVMVRITPAGRIEMVTAR